MYTRQNEECFCWMLQRRMWNSVLFWGPRLDLSFLHWHSQCIFHSGAFCTLATYRWWIKWLKLHSMGVHLKSFLFHFFLSFSFYQYGNIGQLPEPITPKRYYAITTKNHSQKVPHCSLLDRVSPIAQKTHPMCCRLFVSLLKRPIKNFSNIGFNIITYIGLLFNANTDSRVHAKFGENKGFLSTI